VFDRQILSRLGVSFLSLGATGSVICVDIRCPLKLRVRLADDYVILGRLHPSRLARDLFDLVPCEMDLSFFFAGSAK